jgi:prepilin-type N-terminal cleavage/methylation domain-containing protein
MKVDRTRSHLPRRQQSAGFTLPELLVIVVILGVIAAVGSGAFFYLIRRARVQSVALEVAGWLEQVRNTAADRVADTAQEGGCLVAFTSDTYNAGEPIASADCPMAEPILRVPPGVQDDSVTIDVAGPSSFVFTPRGMWIDTSGSPGGANDNEFQLTIRLNNSLPIRCVRLSPTLGSVEIGRPPNSTEAICQNWQTL